MGNKNSILFIFLLLNISAFSQTITSTVITPVKNQYINNNIPVKASVKSTYQLTSVIASISGFQSSLIYNSVSTYFEGNISTSGLHQGDTLTLLITITDILNNQQSSSVSVIYDPPPVITLKEPLNESVAHTTLPLKIFCIDNDTCNVIVGYRGNAIYTGKIKDSINTVLNLLNYDGTSDSLSVEVWDTRLQHTTVKSMVYVDTSSELQEYYVSDKKIWDFNFGKILKSDGFDLSYPTIMNIKTGDYTLIPLKMHLYPQSFLTPYGATLSGVDSSLFPSSYSWAYDWNNNTVYTLGQLNSANSLSTISDYAIWSNGNSLLFRNLLTRNNTIVSTNAGNWMNAVTNKGQVVYWDNTYNINSYINNSNTVLTNNDNNKWNTYTIADETNIVYRKHDPCCTNQKYAIYLINGNNNILLSDMGTKEPSPQFDYQVKSKYVAFTKIGSSGQTNVWLRDTVGNQSQITFYGSNANIDLLSPNGGLLIFYGNRRYMTLSNGQLLGVSSNLGKTYYSDSSYYLAIGRVLYKIASLSTKVFSDTVLTYSSLAFCTGSNVSLSASNGNGYTYQWYKNGNLILGDTARSKLVVASGSYFCKIINQYGSSVISQTLTIKENPNPVKPIINWNGSQLSTTATGVNYQWLLNDAAISGATNSTYKPSIIGIYKLQVIDSNSCKNISDSFNLVIITAINNPSSTPDNHIAKLLPNPATTELMIQFQQIPIYPLTIELVTADGQIIKQINAQDQATTIPLNGIKTGNYFLKIIGKNYNQTQQLMIHH